MTVPCAHWHACGVRGGGACTHPERPHGGIVSIGICMRHCAHYDGPPRGVGDAMAAAIAAAAPVRRKCWLCRAAERILNAVAPSRLRRRTLQGR